MSITMLTSQYQHLPLFHIQSIPTKSFNNINLFILVS